MRFLIRFFAISSLMVAAEEDGGDHKRSTTARENHNVVIMVLLLCVQMKKMKMRRKREWGGKRWLRTMVFVVFLRSIFYDTCHNMEKQERLVTLLQSDSRLAHASSLVSQSRGLIVICHCFLFIFMYFVHVFGHFCLLNLTL